MALHHEFTVPVPVDEAWRALLDIEWVAPRMPGASVEDYDGKTVTGSVKVEVGPITVTYRGTAVFEEQDESAHRMVLIASGRETRGQGTARATVSGTLTGHDGATTVSMRTDLAVTGRPAQFGRGVSAEVGDWLICQFTRCLAQRLGEPETGPGRTGEQETAEDCSGAGPARPGARRRAARSAARDQRTGGQAGRAGTAGDRRRGGRDHPDTANVDSMGVSRTQRGRRRAAGEGVRNPRPTSDREGGP
ncbi:SRPBCC family protein [Streptomyces sp. NPDC088921]|uniref:SRPBCC family protein n=1 Tax=unclassified Streptomyces TaxID=2593676 RepID=UPI003413039C